MNLSETSRSWNNDTIKNNQLIYKRYFTDLKQNLQGMHKHMFLLSILSILFLLILLFYSFGSSTKKQVSIDLPRQRRYDLLKTKLEGNDEEPIIFSKYEYLNQTRKPSENVIAFLVPSFTGDVRLAYNHYPKLRIKIHQLDERLNDNYTTDVIIFHTGYPFRGDILIITEGSRRQIEFVNIDQIFYQFSPGFDPHLRDPNWTQKGKWNYHHVCYFWFKQVFEMKIIQRYKYMMRLDDDSQILGKWPNVFDLMAKRKAVYIANKREVDLEYILPGLTLVRNFTAAYIAKNRISVQNPVLLADAFNHTIEVPHFWNNFEVIDLSFMKRDDVIDFTDAVDESKGIFLYRWGDAPLRYITLALFANATQILHRQQLGLIYCHPC